MLLAVPKSPMGKGIGVPSLRGVWWKRGAGVMAPSNPLSRSLPLWYWRIGAP
jgi:hypothetical protein